MDTIKIKIGAIVVLLVAIVGLGSYALRLSSNNTNSIELQDESYDIEYGKQVDIDTEYLLDTDDQDVIDSIEVDTSSIKNESGKDYPAIGKYNVEVTYKVDGKEQSQTLTVLVEDTTKPEFTTSTDEVVLTQGDSSHDFNEDFAVSDLSDTTLEFDLSKVDFDTAGTYTATAKASDAQGNKANKTFTVTIEASEETTEDTTTSSDTSTEYYYDNTTNYSTDSSTQTYDEQYYIDQGYSTYTAEDGTIYYYAPGYTLEDALYN